MWAYTVVRVVNFEWSGTILTINRLWKTMAIPKKKKIIQRSVGKNPMVKLKSNSIKQTFFKSR